MRVGVDVGGTNTDAVVMDGDHVLAAFKAPTTADVGGGIVDAIRSVLAQANVAAHIGRRRRFERGKDTVLSRKSSWRTHGAGWSALHAGIVTCRHDILKANNRALALAVARQCEFLGGLAAKTHIIAASASRGAYPSNIGNLSVADNGSGSSAFMLENAMLGTNRNGGDT